jgi:choline-glycine betaine transporter
VACIHVRKFIFEVVTAVTMLTLVWETVSSGRVGRYPQFSETVAPSSPLKTETVCFSEILISTLHNYPVGKVQYNVSSYSFKWSVCSSNN